MENKLNHFDQKGNAVMVDVSGKIPTSRTAVARVAGIMAVKQTSHLIPMCHPLMI